MYIPSLKVFYAGRGPRGFLGDAVCFLNWLFSHGAILVYDITDEDSFQKVKNWVKELKKMLGDDICLCIAGLFTYCTIFIGNKK